MKRAVAAALLTALAALAGPASAELLPGEARFTGDRVSLDVKDADLQDVLRLFADVARLNLVLDQSIKGKTITLRLDDVPWDQALDLVLRTHGLGASVEGNVARVAPSSKLTQEADQSAKLRTAQQEAGDLRLVARTLSNARAAEVEKLVQRLLTSRGTTFIDPRTNTLFIRDVFPEIQEAIDLLEVLDSGGGVLGQQHAAAQGSVEALRVRVFEIPAHASGVLGDVPMQSFPLSGPTQLSAYSADAMDAAGLDQRLSGAPGARLLDTKALALGLDQPADIDLAALRASAASPSLRLVITRTLDGGREVLTFRAASTDGASARAGWHSPSAGLHAISLVDSDDSGRPVRHLILIDRT